MKGLPMNQYQHSLYYDELLEEYDEPTATYKFALFKATPPTDLVDRSFGEHILAKLPSGKAVLTDAKWVLENPDSDYFAEWITQYRFYLPTIGKIAILEVGDFNYYAIVEGDDSGDDTNFKYQADAIEYITNMIERFECLV
jgi:hypothetical protein